MSTGKCWVTCATASQIPSSMYDLSAIMKTQGEKINCLEHLMHQLCLIIISLQNSIVNSTKGFQSDSVALKKAIDSAPLNVITQQVIDVEGAKWCKIEKIIKNDWFSSFKSCFFI